MALAAPNRVTLAFDIASSARELCRSVARLNDAEHRVLIGRRLTSTTIKPGALLLCDIEGAERDLFTLEVMERLRSVTVLIEVHECRHPAGLSTPWWCVRDHTRCSDHRASAQIRRHGLLRVQATQGPLDGMQAALRGGVGAGEEAQVRALSGCKRPIDVQYFLHVNLGGNACVTVGSDRESADGRAG